MPLEKGGRADKFGNRYEIRCIIYELLNVIREETYSVTIEALGPDEEGTDILVCKNDGTKIHQQCKVRNASNEYWRLSDLNARDIFNKWLFQLNCDDERCVELVSPVGCTFMVDLHDRAMNSTEDAKMFYEHQIKNSDVSFINAYRQFCKYMKLDSSIDADVRKSIEYLKRIKFHQMSEQTCHERTKDLIGFLFCSSYQSVYNALQNFVIEEDNLGKEITTAVLNAYIEKQGLEFRLVNNDPRVLPRVEMLNREFRSGFSPLQNALIDRPEFEQCIAAVKDGKNLIISGNAGYGKSGCVEAILNYCEENLIPHIALKLDQRQPRGNCDLWGRELGLPGAIPFALHSISQHEQAVLLLDQLDALRWTQSNSREALQVCIELIDQVQRLNSLREKKISIVFVCRSYDLNHDKNINSLFNTKIEQDEKNMEWEKIRVQLLDEQTVKQIVGDFYIRLTAKTKQLLRVPSNLYIWTHIDQENADNDYSTTNNLIEEWFGQICRKAISVGIEESALLAARDEIVTLMDKRGCLYVPKKVLACGQIAIDYLISSEILALRDSKIMFVHQSLLDYFISEKMTQQYFSGENIALIIGEKMSQTPARRYQVQMFMQNLLDVSYEDFLSAGKSLVECETSRYYIKYVFYELLSQIENPDELIEEFIVEHCEDVLYKDYLLHNVFYGNQVYTSMLIRNGILSRWLSDVGQKQTVFAILRSISPDLNAECIAFIEEHAFKNKVDDEGFRTCFSHDITGESDELFELRLNFYEKYPECAGNLFVDIKKCFALCEHRIIRIISFWLNNKEMVERNHLYGAEEVFTNNGTFLVKDAQFILDELLGLIPKAAIEGIRLTNWCGRFHYHKNTLERLVVKIIKNANQRIIEMNPELFWSYYEPYMGKNYAIFDELVLDAFKYLPDTCSNDVISYLYQDMDNRIFDMTSTKDNELYLAEEVIRYHGLHCSDELIKDLERAIWKYISPNAVYWYNRRIERNREKVFAPVYWSFWGDLQLQLLHSIPSDRLSRKSKELLKVLERRFEGIESRYDRTDGHSGSVVSPISKKKISKKQWLQIMKNRKLKTRKHRRWKETKGGFIESSIEMYVSDFQSAVGRNPNEMIRLVLDNKESIPECYITSLFSGVALSEQRCEVNQDLFEEMFKNFPCDMESQRADYFCMIIEKSCIYDWSANVLQQLAQIAVEYRGIESKEKDYESMDAESLYSCALNTVRGSAIRAIGHLLWEKKELFEVFKETIDVLTKDENSAIRMASLFALWPIYNIDRDWAADRIVELYERDVRMAAFNDSKNMFFLLYSKYSARVLNIVKRCFEMEDKRLVEFAGITLCEFYILHKEFSDVFSELKKLSEEQIKAILQMAVLYLEKEEYREEAKSIILNCKNSSYDLEFPLSRIFYDNLVDADRDIEFLKEIMSGRVNRRLVFSFVHFLEDNAYSNKEYADVIIALCENVLCLDTEEIKNNWGLDDDLSKLIISLYDECAEGKSQKDKSIAEKCLELWDIMFEKRIGQTRQLSRELMER